MASIFHVSVSPVLEEAARLKMDEHNRAKVACQKRYHDNPNAKGTGTRSDTLDRLSLLSGQDKNHDTHLDDSADAAKISGYVEDAKNDLCVSHAKLLRFEEELIDKITKHGRRMDVTSLHNELLKEAVNGTTSADLVAAKLERAKLDDEFGFEFVEGEQEDVFEHFQKCAFAPNTVNGELLDNYLSSIFQGADCKASLADLREDINAYADDLWAGTERLNDEIVEWCIKDILDKSFLSEKDTKTLQVYLTSPAAISELTSVLNIKSPRNWDWKNAENGLTVVARQNANGKYCIAIEQDIIDLLYLHALAIGWSMTLKQSLARFVSNPTMWPADDLKLPLGADMEKREYYLPGPRRSPANPASGSSVLPACTGPPPPPPPTPPYMTGPPPLPPTMPTFSRPSIPPPPMPTFPAAGPNVPLGGLPRAVPPPMPPFPMTAPPPMPPFSRPLPPPGPPPFPKPGRGRRPKMPPGPPMSSSVPPGWGSNNGGRHRGYPRVAGPPPSNLHGARYQDYGTHFFLSRLPSRNGYLPVVASPLDTQARLMKHLATAARVREAFDGEVHGLSINIQSFASSLPHETILTLLKFFGAPARWRDVFKRFLNMPLDMSRQPPDFSEKVRRRTAGVPVAHGLELLFGELVLFIFDFVVRQNTGEYLYRLRDKGYFVGSAEQCKALVQPLLSCAQSLGLTISLKDCLAEEPIGFLTFGIQGAAPLSFSIDYDKVEAYALHVKKQLSGCTTVITWICTWNKLMGTYASHLFGPLANVFGRLHLEAVTKAYKRMQSIIFEDSNFTDCVTRLLAPHIQALSLDFTPGSGLDAIMFLPTAYGGLGIKSPFTTINLARRALGLVEDPKKFLKDYLADEEKYHAKTSKLFADMDPETREQKFTSIFNNDKDRIAAAFNSTNHSDPATFWPLSEMSKYRERMQYPFLPLAPPMPPSGFPEPYCVVPRLDYVYTNLLCEPASDIYSISPLQELITRDGLSTYPVISAEERWVLGWHESECRAIFGKSEIWVPEGVPMELFDCVWGNHLNMHS